MRVSAWPPPPPQAAQRLRTGCSAARPLPSTISIGPAVDPVTDPAMRGPRGGPLVARFPAPRRGAAPPRTTACGDGDGAPAATELLPHTQEVAGSSPASSIRLPSHAGDARRESRDRRQSSAGGLPFTCSRSPRAPSATRLRGPRVHKRRGTALPLCELCRQYLAESSGSSQGWSMS
jgi:hypothetical protein